MGQPQEVKYTDTKREVIEGHAYESGNGQLIIDAHATDEEHLLAQATHDSQPMYRCRTYLRDLIPKEWRGKKGKFLIDREVTSHGDIISVQIAFIPSNT